MAMIRARKRVLSKAADAIPARLITRSAELLQLTLLRSRDASLSITFDTRPRNDYAQPFLRIILPFMHNCTRIQAPVHILAQLQSLSKLDRIPEVVVDYSETSRPSYPLCNLSSPRNNSDVLRVEQMSIQQLFTRPNVTSISAVHHVSSLSNHVGPPAPTLLLQAELITKLVLTNVHWDDPDNTHASWWHREQLEDGSTSLRLAGALLPRLSSLIELEVHDMHDSETTWGSCTGFLRVTSSLEAKLSGNGNRPCTALPKLSALVISGCTLIASHLLNGIMAPVLQALNYTGPVDPSCIHNFLAVSGCELRALRLHSDLNDDPVRSLFCPPVGFVAHIAACARRGYCPRMQRRGQ